MEKDSPDCDQSDGGQAETDEQQDKNAWTRFGLSRFHRCFNGPTLACSNHEILHSESKAAPRRLFLRRNGPMTDAFDDEQGFDPAPTNNAEDAKRSGRGQFGLSIYLRLSGTEIKDER